MDQIASIDPFDEEPTPIPSSGLVLAPAWSDDTYLDHVFGAGGVLAKRFEGYQPRPGQIALASGVDAAIKGTKHLFAEGPTGTGKSVAYSVPATYHAATHGRRVVICTANIALTEQLAQKDLPLLQEILPWKFDFALMKGRGNYLCADRLLELEAERYGGGFSQGSIDDEQIEAIKAWAQDTATGDVSELAFVPDPMVWRKFSKGSDECKGKNCKSFDGCFAYAAKRASRKAHVVVTNYHLLFAALIVRRVTEKNIILPGYDVAILDEAHKAAEIARGFFGFDVTAARCARPARQLDKLKNDKGAADLVKKLNGAAHGFFNALVEYKRRGGYKVRLKEQLANDELVARAWKWLDEALDQASYMIRQVASAQMTADAKAEWSKAAERAAETRIAVEMAMVLEDADEQVYFLEEARGGRDGEVKLTLGMRPIRVADRLRDELFNGRPAGDTKPKSTYMADEDDGEPDEEERREAKLRTRRSVIVTSATLAVNGGFDYVADELGAPGGSYAELIAESPFDWATKALLIVPEMPDPSTEREKFGAAVPEVVIAAIELAEGRTLALFTSYKALEASYQALKRSGCPYRVLKQGDKPRTRLVQEFRADVSSVLLGTESMWAGVDVPGESLSLVIIDKIPFPTPDDPVLDAIASRDKKWFFNHAVPRAVIALKQGVGRLIRAVGDVGVVVICDPRLITKPYGKQILRSFPEMQRSRKLEHITQFLPPATKPADDFDIPF